MNRPPVLYALLGLLSFSALGGCTEVEKARFEANDKRAKRNIAEKALEERAKEYWSFARWYSWEETARFFEQTEDQLAHLRAGVSLDPAKLPKRDAIEVQFIFVDPETRKTAEVRTRWNEFVPGTQGVAENTETQKWYRRGGQWWLAPSSGIPDDEFDDLGDEQREARANLEEVPELETVVPDPSAER